MTYALEGYEIERIIKSSVKLALSEFLKKPKKNTISERLAYKKFGKDHVRRWLDGGIIECTRNGSKANSRKNFSYYQLSMIATREGIEEKD